MKNYNTRIPQYVDRNSVNSMDIQIASLRKSLTAITDTDTCNRVIDEILLLTNEKEDLIDKNRKKVGM